MAETGFRVAKTAAQTFSWPAPSYSTVAYVTITWQQFMDPDTTGGFDLANARWVAPANGTLLTGWHIWNQANVSNIVTPVSKLMKNAGGFTDAAACGSIGEYANTSTQASTMRVPVLAGDVLHIGNYCWPNDPTHPIVIDDRPEHTYWWGSFIPS